MDFVYEIGAVPTKILGAVLGNQTYSINNASELIPSDPARYSTNH